ncbi:hypothetical protein HYPGJ_30333 [Hyphomicrobium sp. GJ21]|nr:hypothetical protein HYPGJ_30333 [Hyphomicrobium sp. GJ21]
MRGWFRSETANFEERSRGEAELASGYSGSVERTPMAKPDAGSVSAQPKHAEPGVNLSSGSTALLLSARCHRSR